MCIFVAYKKGMEQLDGHLFPHCRMLAQIDGAHPSLTQFRLHQVFSVQQLACEIGLHWAILLKATHNSTVPPHNPQKEGSVWQK